MNSNTALKNSQPKHNTEFSSSSSSSKQQEDFRLPHPKTFVNAAKIAIFDDKPILLDYWVSSLDRSSGTCIGVKGNKQQDSASFEKLLVKSEDEYTSPISKIYKSETEYIIVTENSIYLVDVNIVTKKISGEL